MIAARTAGVDRAARPGCCRWRCSPCWRWCCPNVAGWGPREGVTAWVFGAAGLGAAQGVATAVVFGVMVFVASLPGAVVLVVAWLRRAGVRRGRAAARAPGTVGVGRDGAAHA